MARECAAGPSLRPSGEGDRPEKRDAPGGASPSGAMGQPIGPPSGGARWNGSAPAIIG